MKDKKTLLSTSPLGRALADKALKQLFIIENISFIKTENVIDKAILEEIKKLASETIAAVFTSSNGAEAVIESLQENEIQPSWNVYCLGSATQSLIIKYFISAKIAGTGKNATDVAEAIINDGVNEVFFFCGNQRREELPERLKENEIAVKEVVVYKTIETPVKVEKEYNGILFFSPSAVKSFFSVNSIPADTVLFSIGDTTANAIRHRSTNKIIISDFPSKEKLVETAIQHFRCENRDVKSQMQ